LTRAERVGATLLLILRQLARRIGVAVDGVNVELARAAVGLVRRIVLANWIFAQLPHKIEIRRVIRISKAAFSQTIFVPVLFTRGLISTWRPLDG
jgi:hypothetical protein